MGAEYGYINSDAPAKEYDNSIDFVLKADGTNLTVMQMQAITKVELVYMGTAYSSATHASAFDWSTYESDAKLLVYPGRISGLSAGHDRQARIIIYDSGHTNGIVWDDFELKIIDVGETP